MKSELKQISKITKILGYFIQQTEKMKKACLSKALVLQTFIIGSPKDMLLKNFNPSLYWL